MFLPSEVWNFSQEIARASSSVLLHLYDPLSKTKFLVDSSSDVCVLPAQACQKFRPIILHLYAANGTKIPVYKRHTMQFNLKLRCSFEWTLYIGDVSQPILGADILSHYGLLVDLKGCKLLDPLTSITTSAQHAPGESTRIAVIQSNHQFSSLQKSFPTLTQPYSAATPVKHHVSHRTKTTGPPTHAKARRLAPERLKLAKQEFESLMRQGIIRPSSSNWSSALHIVPKKNGDLRLCGDYRGLNSCTVENSYPVPNIQEFSSQFLGSSKSSAEIRNTKIDKSVFDVSSITFLSHSVTSHGIAPLQDKYPDADISIATDASSIGIGVVLQQHVHSGWKSLAFFSKKFDKVVNFTFTPTTNPTLPRFSTTNLPVPHDSCATLTSSHSSPRDALSRNISAVTSSVINYAAIAADQTADPELQELLNNPAFQFKNILPPGTDVHIYADVSTETSRPFLPKDHRQPVFHKLHNFSHPSIRATQKMVIFFRLAPPWPLE
ncbi:uncharacterized protein LOC143019324 [Oratosquilla oratoria]|uniref:uncharacterized protein LOC143019324 n=1 Tax=Oratosquilla oratoria TaxID=337810 RepID=UPI003F7652A6